VLVLLASLAPIGQGLNVTLVPPHRGAVSTIVADFTTEVAVNELWVTLPPEFTPHRCPGQGYSMCSSNTSLTLSDGVAHYNVSHSLQAQGTGLKLLFPTTVTINGTASVAVTNVLLANRCEEVQYLLQAMHCTDDYWGVKRCIEKYRAGNMASTGKPEGCSLCTACKASPYGLWDCEHDGVRVMMPVDSTTCPSYAAIPKSSYP
jgi:hypothetical protein